MHPQAFIVQMCSTMSAEQNFNYLQQQLTQANLKQPALVCLPETWICFNKDGATTLEQSKSNHLWVEKLAQLCRQFGIWLAAGTIALPSENTGKYYAASLLFNEQGEVVAQYNKIHLFDAQVQDGSGGYRESKFTQAGSDVVVVDSPFGRIGLSVCYDVRFAGLYQKMMALGADIILVPSAFTTVTGKAHWLPLLQARAIETQCYVLAAAQVGQHDNGRATYGHSVAISPWGEVLANAKTELTNIECQLDLSELQQVRASLPVHQHNRFKSTFYE
ncbi:carbon-nitrogen hydrolase family protein [Pseudoalteromonas sp. MTN2-4]|uniref:carbon-nitrogen hydrolase family protein n=1 Tax=Pseudoalteromonas sp. MTN2-4 TaxID=3056555 RepID=UPI0036F24154